MATTYARTIGAKFWVDWDFDGAYTEETSQLISASGDFRFAPPASSITASRGIVSDMTITLANDSNRYSPLDTGGALYANIRDGKLYHAPCYMEVTINGGSNYYRVFTGVLKIPREIGMTSKLAPTVTFECRGREEAILQRKITTTLADYKSWYDNGKTESELIAEFLQDAGMEAADYTLDDGLFIIPWAWLDDGSAIEACWELAAACGGRFYCDPDGEFRYENAQHWLMSPHNASTETISKANFVELRPFYNDTELYKTVQVTAQTRGVGDTETIWSAERIYTIPANSTLDITAKLQYPVYEVTTPVAGTHFKAATSGGTNITSNVTISSQTNYAQRIDFTFTNSHATSAAELRVFYVEGRFVQSEYEIEESDTSTNTFWTAVAVAKYRADRTRSIRANRWVQTEAQASFMSEFLRDRHELPRLFFTLRRVAGDPERRLGDHITISDADVMTSNRDAFITGIAWRFGGGVFEQDITAIDATTYYEHGADYFIIGTDALAAANSDYVFY